MNKTDYLISAPVTFSSLTCIVCLLAAGVFPSACVCMCLAFSVSLRCLPGASCYKGISTASESKRTAVPHLKVGLW